MRLLPFSLLCALLAWLPSAALSQPEVDERGSLSGRVLWEGDVPVVEPFAVRTNGHFARTKLIGKHFPNPHVPIIDEASRGVQGAVVWLRDVDVKKSRPWDHPPVHVEQADFQFAVRQGEATSNVGFVRCGDPVEFVSLQSELHILRARGDAFFALPFVQPRQPTVRKLGRAGLVELSSGNGFYWMSAHLFVRPDPYITRTDAQGRFHLTDVPAGEYAIVCWMPNWNIMRREREPEAGSVNQIMFAKPVELERRITIEPRKESQANFTVYQQQFQQY